ncbi:MAG: hypothetical protein QNK30_05730 [Bacteroidales bacterium]|nr:hypothetical protein [Bacteroidales bacterium]
MDRKFARFHPTGKERIPGIPAKNTKINGKSYRGILRRKSGDGH